MPVQGTARANLTLLKQFNNMPQQQTDATIQSLAIVTRALLKLEQLNSSYDWEAATLPANVEPTALPQAIHNLRYLRSRLALQLPESPQV